MKLKSITPHMIGPFVNGPTIEFEPDITVIVGANDSGKSKLLKAIELATTELSVIQQDQINDAMLSRLGNNWNTSTDCYIDAVFSLSPQDIVDPVWRSAVAYMYRKYVTPSNRGYADISYLLRDGIKVSASKRPPFKLSVLNVSESIEKIGDLISLSTKSDIEKRVIQICSGSTATSTKYDAVSPSGRKQTVRRFSERLTQSIRQATFGRFKYSIDIEFDSAATSLHLHVIDSKGEVSNLSKRGSGIQSLISILIFLETLDKEAHNLILFDEPDQTLHPNLQRMLRQVFEHYARQSNIQIVYSTHSPQMINNFKPNWIRIIRESSQIEESPIVEKRASESGFTQVRQSLGVLPCDSLSFADTVLLVEGETEFRAIDSLMRKYVGDEKWQRLSTGLAIISGRGDKLTQYADICKEMGCRVIVLVDGDKGKSFIEKLSRKIGGDNVVTLTSGAEIEDLVDQDIYISAALKVFGNTKNSEENIDILVSARMEQVHGSKMLSKRVEASIRDVAKHQNVEIRYSKTDVFCDAIEMSETIQSHPSLDKLVSLIDQPRHAL